MDLKRMFTDISLFDFEKKVLGPLYLKADKIIKKGEKITATDNAKLKELAKTIKVESTKIYKGLSYWQRSMVARHTNRPYSLDYIDSIFDDFIEMHGDRNFRDDAAIVTGMAQFKGQSVVVVAEQKGRTTEENLKRNFGMPQPEGYRKAMRIFQFAEKFNKPIITFIDTAGAFPGLEGEERSQGEAIARNLKIMAGLKVPVIAVVIGEGGSGGALGIGVVNHVLMLENSIYSVISPESCASILWRDANEKERAADALKNDAKTSLKFKIIDEIVAEGVGGAHRDWETTMKNVSDAISKNLKKLSKIKPDDLMKQRIEKYAAMGEFKIIK